MYPPVDTAVHLNAFFFSFDALCVSSWESARHMMSGSEGF